MKTEIQITKHAKKRFKQRTGLPKKVLENKVESAFKDGKTKERLKGTIKRYIGDLPRTRKKAFQLLLENGFYVPRVSE